VVPAPLSDWISRDPCIISRKLFASGSPRPEPLFSFEKPVVSLLNAARSSGKNAGSIPTPVSLILMEICFFIRMVVCRNIDKACSVNLIELSRIILRAFDSPFYLPGPQGISPG